MARGLVDIRALGNKELEARFKRLELKVQKKIIRKALRKGGKLVAARARQLIAQKTTRRTGRLAKGIQIRSGRRSRSLISIRVQTKPRAHFDIPPDDPYYYPAIIEYGAPAQGLAPRPFLRPAADEKEDEVFRAVEAEIDRAIKAL